MVLLIANAKTTLSFFVDISQILYSIHHAIRIEVKFPNGITQQEAMKLCPYDIIYLNENKSLKYI